MATGEPAYDPTVASAAIVSIGSGLTLSGAGALTNDLTTGKAGGQTIIGGTAASESLTFSSTSNGTKGTFVFGSTSGMVYSEVLAALGVGGSPIANVGPLQLVGAGGAEGTLFANIYSMIGFKSSDIYIGVRETTNNIEAAVGASSTGTNRARMGALTNHALALVTNNVDRLTVNAGGGFTVTEANDFAFGTTTGTKFGTATTQKLGFYNATPVVQQTRGGTLTNNVTVGGTTDQIDDFTSLTIYATDAAAIRNDIYQLARAVRLHDVALRALGFES